MISHPPVGFDAYADVQQDADRIVQAVNDEWAGRRTPTVVIVAHEQTLAYSSLLPVFPRLR
jgi:hypothetical protein